MHPIAIYRNGLTPVDSIAVRNLDSIFFSRGNYFLILLLKYI